MFSISFKTAVAALCTGLALTTAAGIENGVNVRSDDDTLKTITLENKFMELKIGAHAGGRIYSIKSPSGKEFVWGNRGGNSGVLDDKTVAQQKYANIINKGSDVNGVRYAEVVLSVEEESLKTEKTIRLYENSPSIYVVYRYANTGKSAMQIEKMVRNYFIAGGKAGPEDRYIWMGPEGIQRRFYPFAGAGVFLENYKPWIAVLDTRTTDGIGIHIDSKYFKRYYVWSDNRAPNPSLEWNLELDILPGKSVEIPIQITLFEGLNDIVNIDSKGIMAMSPKVNGTDLELEIRYMWTSPEKAPDVLGLRLDYLDLERRTVWGETVHEFINLQPGVPQSCSTSQKMAEEGTYIIAKKLMTQNAAYSHSEFPQVVGRSSGRYYKGTRKAEEDFRAFIFTPEDTERGYALHAGGKEIPFQALKDMSFCLGKDEREAVELGVIAVKRLGKTILRIEENGVDVPPDAVEVFTQFKSSAPGRKMAEIDYALVAGREIEMEADDEKSFWVRFNGSLLTPGKHVYQVTVIPQDAPSVTRMIEVEVLPVKASYTAKTAPLSVYHTWQRLSPRDRNLELMHIARVQQIMFYFPYSNWNYAVKTRRDASGKLSFDFSTFDRMAVQPKVEGFEHIMIMYSLFNRTWLRLGDGTDLADSPDAQRAIFHALVERLKSFGYKEIQLCVMDEPNIQDAISEKNIERLKFIRSIHPDVKLHTTVNHYSKKLINELSPYIDVWVPAAHRGMDFQLKKDQADGSVSLNREKTLIGAYTGAFYNHYFDDIQGIGWRAAFAELDFYSVFAWDQASAAGVPNWKLIARDGQTAWSTPAQEGLREGTELFMYHKTLAELIEKINAIPGKSPEDTAKVNAARTFLRELFGTRIPLAKMRGGHGAQASMRLKENERQMFLSEKSEVLRHVHALSVLPAGSQAVWSKHDDLEMARKKISLAPDDFTSVRFEEDFSAASPVKWVYLTKGELFGFDHAARHCSFPRYNGKQIFAETPVPAGSFLWRFTYTPTKTAGNQASLSNAVILGNREDKTIRGITCLFSPAGEEFAEVRFVADGRQLSAPAAVPVGEPAEIDFLYDADKLTGSFFVNGKTVASSRIMPIRFNALSLKRNGNPEQGLLNAGHISKISIRELETQK